MQDYDCEEKDSEKKSDDKKEKKDFEDYLFYNKSRPFILINYLSFYGQPGCLSAGCDYSMSVYSPPDKAII